GALRRARLASAAFGRGADLPPLCGIRVAIKDVTPTKGVRTTHGSKLFESHVPDEDALVVQRLRAAGAIVIGKTNTPEFAFGPNTVNAVFGATRNPWDLALTAGGSSGGSAAALGTGPWPPPAGAALGRPRARPGVVLRGRGVPHDAGIDSSLSLRARLGHLLGRRPDGPDDRGHGADALGDGGRRRPLADLLRGRHARAPEGREDSIGEGLEDRR